MQLTSRNHGHVLGDWYTTPQGNHGIASYCELLDKMKKGQEEIINKSNQLVGRVSVHTN